MIVEMRCVPQFECTKLLWMIETSLKMFSSRHLWLDQITNTYLFEEKEENQRFLNNEGDPSRLTEILKIGKIMK